MDVEGHLMHGLCTFKYFCYLGSMMWDNLWVVWLLIADRSRDGDMCLGDARRFLWKVQPTNLG